MASKSVWKYFHQCRLPWDIWTATQSVCSRELLRDSAYELRGLLKPEQKAWSECEYRSCTRFTTSLCYRHLSKQEEQSAF